MVQLHSPQTNPAVPGADRKLCTSQWSLPALCQNREHLAVTSHLSHSSRCRAEVIFRAVIFSRLRKASEIRAGVDMIEGDFSVGYDL